MPGRSPWLCTRGYLVRRGVGPTCVDVFQCVIQRCRSGRTRVKTEHGLHCKTVTMNFFRACSAGREDHVIFAHKTVGPRVAPGSGDGLRQGSAQIHEAQCPRKRATRAEAYTARPPRPASSKRRRDLRREHMLPSSAARGVASSSHLYKSYSPPTHSSKE